MAFEAISLVAADSDSNEVDYDAWLKFKAFYDAYVGQTPAANTIPVYSSATALSFQNFTAKAIALAACGNNSQILAELGINTAYLESNDTYSANVNGDFDIWQRGTTFASIADGAFFADRWKYMKNSAAVHDAVRSTSVPSVGQAGRLLNYSVLVDNTTADATIAAGEYALLRTSIEGWMWAPLAQRVCTLSFWVAATKVGTYCVALTNSAGDRSYVAEYTVNVSNTWEYKTVTILASPSGGTWDYVTGVGVNLTFSIAMGSTYHTTAGAWQTRDYYATANQVNGCDSTSNNFSITNVRLVAGSVAKPLIQRPYPLELLLAQRYFYQVGGAALYDWIGHGFCPTTTQADVTVPFPTPMRAVPALTYGSATGFAASDGAASPACTGVALNASYNQTIHAANVILTGLTSLTAGRACSVYANGTLNGYMRFSAEI